MRPAARYALRPRFERPTLRRFVAALLRSKQVSLSVKRFAPKGVAQLAVLEEEALLLVLSDGTLAAYSLPSLEPATAPGAAGLARARGVTCVPCCLTCARRLRPNHGY